MRTKILTIIFFTFITNFCLAQTSKEQILAEVNELLRTNPTDHGFYCVVSLNKDKLVVHKYDKNNLNWAKSEAYLTDLTKFRKALNFGALDLMCAEESRCVKIISIVTYNSSPDPDKWIKSINSANIEPVYGSFLSLEFKPDSKIYSRILDYFGLLYKHYID